jgi:hypothetical protein
MHLPKTYEHGARTHRVRYAIANILRDRIANEGAFANCFEMEDADEAIRTILRRGLKNPKLRAALERSHLVNLTEWLRRYPDLHEAYAESRAEEALNDRGMDFRRRASAIRQA